MDSVGSSGMAREVLEALQVVATSLGRRGGLRSCMSMLGAVRSRLAKGAYRAQLSRMKTNGAGRADLGEEAVARCLTVAWEGATKSTT